MDFADVCKEHGRAAAGERPFVGAYIAGGGLLLPGMGAAQRPFEAVVVPGAFFDATFEGIGFAQKFGNKSIGGGAVERVGIAGLLDFAVVHHHNFIRHFQRFFLIMCHQNAGDAQLVVNVAQPGAQLFAHFGIERAERLVEQQKLGRHRQRAR